MSGGEAMTKLEHVELECMVDPSTEVLFERLTRASAGNIVADEVLVAGDVGFRTARGPVMIPIRTICDARIVCEDRGTPSHVLVSVPDGVWRIVTGRLVPA